MFKIAVVGTGYVGLVTGTCLAELKNKVTCVDNNEEKIAGLKNGKIPIYEPGLGSLVRANMKKGRLKFTTDIGEGVKSAEIVFIAVNTPPRPDGNADLSYVEAVSREIAGFLNDYKVIVEKSTVPVETGERIEQTIRLHNRKKAPFAVASNPEFLREGQAVKDFLHPDRVVIGVQSQKAEEILRKLYKPLNAPIIVTDLKSAELIKHASNSFLATKISFINAVANICEKVGADVTKVAEGMGLDERIGRGFLAAGAGFGGSCFPKDLAAFIRLAERYNYDFQLLKAVEQINHQQKKNLVSKLEEALWILQGKTIGVLGLAFKPNTDDLRNAPALDIIGYLQAAGAQIKVYDPQAMKKAKSLLPQVKFEKDPYAVARGSDCLLLITEWDEFKNLDWERIKKLLRSPVVIDGRNIYNPERMRTLGFRYWGVGRK